MSIPSQVDVDLFREMMRLPGADKLRLAANLIEAKDPAKIESVAIPLVEGALNDLRRDALRRAQQEGRFDVCDRCWFRVCKCGPT